MNLWNQNELDVKKLNKPYWSEIGAGLLGIDVTGFLVWMVAHKRWNSLRQWHLGVQIEVFGKCIICVNTDSAWKIHYWFRNNALFQRLEFQQATLWFLITAPWTITVTATERNYHFSMPVQSIRFDRKIQDIRKKTFLSQNLCIARKGNI